MRPIWIVLLVALIPVLFLIVIARFVYKAVDEGLVVVNTEAVDPAGDYDRWLATRPTTTTTAATRTVWRPATNQPRTTAPIAGGELADMIRQGFARFGATVAEQAVRVAGCESTGDETGHRLNPAARGPGGHLGLFQIAWQWHSARAQRLGFTQAQLLEAGPNIAVAADLYGESKWGPWECRWAA